MLNRLSAHDVLPKRLCDELERILSANVANRARRGTGKGLVSFATQDERRRLVFQAFAQLWQLGFRMQSPRSLGERHIRALVGHWDRGGLAAGTLHNRITHLAAFCGWIGKAGMAKAPAEYCGEGRVARSHVAREDKSLEGKGLDPLQLIERARQVDGRLALYLSLQHHLGFRAKESMEFRPAVSLSADGSVLEVFEGTKGGKRRTVTLDTEDKRATVKWALEVAGGTRSGRVRWPDRTYRQAMNHLYYLVRSKLGLTKAQAGRTMHALRHGFVQRTYQILAGQPAPVRGGSPATLDWHTHHWALLQTSKEVGHSRTHIVGAYAGSFGHALRGSKLGDAPVVLTRMDRVTLAGGAAAVGRPVAAALKFA